MSSRLILRPTPSVQLGHLASRLAVSAHLRRGAYSYCGVGGRHGRQCKLTGGLILQSPAGSVSTMLRHLYEMERTLQVLALQPMALHREQPVRVVRSDHVRWTRLLTWIE